MQFSSHLALPSSIIKEFVGVDSLHFLRWDTTAVVATMMLHSATPFQVHCHRSDEENWRGIEANRHVQREIF